MSEVLDIASLNLPALPIGWHYKAVSEIGATGEQPVLTGPFGTNLGRADFVESGVPLLTIGCLTQGGINLEKALFVSEEKAKELSRYRLKEGDLLFSRMASVGRAGLVPKWLEGALFNYHIMRLRLDVARIDTRLFINYVRGAKQVRDYLKAVNHGATRDGINTEQLLGLPVAVPPLAEQHEIVAEIEKQFSRLDEAVANLQRVKANLKRYKASILKAAVEGRLVETEVTQAHREGRTYETGEQLLQRILEERKENGKGKRVAVMRPDVDDVYASPDGWVWSTCDAAIDFIGAGASFKCDERPPAQDEIGVLKVSALSWGTYDEAESKTCTDIGRVEEKFLVRDGDFLFSRANTIELVGACVIVGKTTKQLMLSDKTLRFQLNTRVLPAWLQICLRCKFGRYEIERLATGNQESMRNIGQDRIRQIRMPLPPFAEQVRIVAEVDRHLSIVREVEAEVDTNLKRAQALRQSKLRSVFSLPKCKL